jgi:hypothetical protein
MDHFRFLAAGLAAALLLVPHPGASAEEPDLLAEARALREKKDVHGALGRVAEAIARAHEGGDLLAEGSAAALFEELAGNLQVEAAGPPPSAPRGALPGRREAMGMVMARLAPRRNGAFVSAGALARNLLLQSSRFGDDYLRKEARDVIAAWREGGKSGEIAGFHEEWGLTMGIMNLVGPVGRGNADGFVRFRKEVLKAVAQGWADEVTHAATELAAFYAKFQEPMDGLDGLKQAEKACREAKDPAVVARWRRAVQSRLRDAPAELLAPLERVEKEFKGGIPGGPGGDAPEPRTTGLGAVFGKWKPKDALVRVRRTDTGFLVLPAWNSKARLQVPYGPGAKHLDADGLWFVFEGKSVGLDAVDLEGRRAKPGDGARDLVLRAMYPLATGETWVLARDGTVTVSK